MSNRKPIKMTKVNLSELTTDNMEKNAELFFTYRELNEALREQTGKARALENTLADVEAAAAKVRRLRTRFLLQAAEVSEKIATEPNWMLPYLNDAGELCIESPFTMKDQRIAARVAHRQLQKAASEGSEIDDSELFDDGEDDEK